MRSLEAFGIASLFVLFSSGCNGRIQVGVLAADSGSPGSPRGGNDAGFLEPSEAGGAGDASSPGPINACTLPQSPLCTATQSGVVTPSTLDELTAALVHRWLLCGTQSVFGSDGDVGIDITADGHFYKLYPGEGGGAARGSGFEKEGTWEAFPEGAGWQVNLDIFGEGFIPASPAFTTTPQALRLTPDTVNQGTYIVDTEVPVAVARCSAASMAEAGVEPEAEVPEAAPPINNCNFPTSPLCSETQSGIIAPSSLADLTAAISHRWIRCGLQSLFSSDGDVGIEITADGHFYVLFPGQDGGAVRGSGLDQEGTWEAVAEGTGPDPWQVYLHVFGSGGTGGSVFLTMQPQEMRITTDIPSSCTYVLDPSIPVAFARCAQ